MKNLKLYENFSGSVPPKADDLLLEVTGLLGLEKDYLRYKSLSPNRTHFRLNFKGSSSDKTTLLLKLFKERGYSFELFPKLTEHDIKAKILSSRIDYSNPFENMEYGISIIADCIFKETEKRKVCFNLTHETLSCDILGGAMRDILANDFNENNIDILFWNVEYMVAGKFEHTNTYREDGITSLEFTSYETSDNKEYSMSVSASGSFNAGYDLESIEDIDFV